MPSLPAVDCRLLIVRVVGLFLCGNMGLPCFVSHARDLVSNAPTVRAAKVALLHNALVGGDEITPADVERDSLSAIDATGIRAEADSLGGAFVPKIMCRAGGEDAAPPSVRLEFVPAGSVFAGVTGMSSALSLETDLMGTLSIVGRRVGDACVWWKACLGVCGVWARHLSFWLNTCFFF